MTYETPELEGYRVGGVWVSHYLSALKTGFTLFVTSHPIRDLVTIALDTPVRWFDAVVRHAGRGKNSDQ